MNNLVQIICGCAGEDTIEECARVPTILGAEIVVVHGIWPCIRYFQGKEDKYRHAENWIPPTHHVDNVKEIAKKHNWHFIQMEDYAYNGIQYNKALDYIEEKGMPCENIWFVDSDECIDPIHTNFLQYDVALAKEKGTTHIRFWDRVEIMPEWKFLRTSIEIGNEGIVWGEGLKARRKDGFDGNWKFQKSSIGHKYVKTNIPLLHLHNMSKNSADRIQNGIYHSGSLKINLDKLKTGLPETEYIKMLKGKYKTFYTDRKGKESYIGPTVYEKGEKNE